MGQDGPTAQSARAFDKTFWFLTLGTDTVQCLWYRSQSRPVLATTKTEWAVTGKLCYRGLLTYNTFCFLYFEDSPSVSLAVHFSFFLCTGVMTQEDEWWLPDSVRISRNSTARESKARTSWRSPSLLSVCVFHTVQSDAFYSQLQDSWHTRHFLIRYFWFCISYSLNVCLPRSEAWQQPSIRRDNWFSCSEFLQTKLSA